MSSTAYPQRASKATDIALLLDPSYSPTRAMYDNQIYVDCAGQAHDPDFRLFAPASYSPKHRDFFASESDLDVDDGISLYSPPRSSFDSYRYRPDSRASDPVYSHDAGHVTLAYASDEEPRREFNKLRRRRFSLDHYLPVKELPEPVENEELRTESTPRSTCSHSFRRRWHALRLRTQVAAFRMRKRVVRIVSG